MWKDQSELAKPMWILMPHVISLQKIFLAEELLNDYVNHITGHMIVRQFLSGTFPCLLSGFINKEFMTARM